MGHCPQAWCGRFKIGLLRLLQALRSGLAASLFGGLIGGLVAAGAAAADGAGGARGTPGTGGASPAAAAVVVGSKRFTESYILGELVCQTLRQAGIACEHKQGLGNTGILEAALASGSVQIYPEYTGTIVRELLKREGAAVGKPSLTQLNEWLAPKGLRVAVPLGFNNTYALALREADAERLNLKTLSDLAALPSAERARLRLGLSHEFLVRGDGWPALKQAYQLPFTPGAGLDHGLAYEAIKAGQIDLMDVYSTDAKIGRYGLRVLADDRGFFPKYDAVLLMRSSVPAAAQQAVQSLQGRISESTMIALNAAVELDGRSFAEVARNFLLNTTLPGASAASGAAPDGAAAASAAAARPGLWQRLVAPDLARLTAQHLLLVFGSLALALLVGVPLGIWAWARPRVAAWVLGAVGVMQTVPSLALLAFLIAWMGSIGFWPALVALFIYALLPVVANTHAGLNGVPPGLPEAARALGLSAVQTLRLVQLPLALPVVLAGARTAAVVNVGTATMAAFIGAGGFGERIVAGLAVNDSTTMLAGAVPAALLALVVQGAFGWLERRAQVGRVRAA